MQLSCDRTSLNPASLLRSTHHMSHQGAKCDSFIFANILAAAPTGIYGSYANVKRTKVSHNSEILWHPVYRSIPNTQDPVMRSTTKCGLQQTSFSIKIFDVPFVGNSEHYKLFGTQLSMAKWAIQLLDSIGICDAVLMYLNAAEEQVNLQIFSKIGTNSPPNSQPILRTPFDVTYYR